MDLGADPELFVTRGGKRVLPAWEFLPERSKAIGTTMPEEERHLRFGTHFGEAFWDGFQAEFTVKPNNCIAYIADTIRAGLSTVLTKAKEHAPRAKLSLQNVFRIPETTLRTVDEKHSSLGCAPSENVYHMSGDTGGDPCSIPHRFAGGHLHLGVFGEFTKNREEQAQHLVRDLDKVLGVWAVGAAASFDSPVRRQYYGLAGEYRLPKHGVEYRVLSNFWLAHPAIVNLVFEIARAVARGQKGLGNIAREHHLAEWEADPIDVIEVINTCDVVRAREMLKKNEERFKALLGIGGKEQAVQVGMEGIEAAIAEPEDLAKNWKLGRATTWRTHSDGPGMNWASASSYMARGKAV